MLEVGAVVDAGGEDDDAGVVAGRRGGGVGEGGPQELAVLVDGAHGVVAEQPGEGLDHGGAVLDDVADAAGVAQVVLQHGVGAVGVAHDVDAGHHAAGSEGDLDAEGVALEAPRGGDQPAGHDPVVEGGLLAGVEVVEEPVQGRDALGQAGLQLPPLGRLDDAGEQVHGPGALGALVVGVDGEGDALAAELGRHQLLDPAQLVAVDLREPLGHPPVGGAHRPVGVEGLVEPRPRPVPVEQASHPGHSNGATTAPPDRPANRPARFRFETMLHIWGVTRNARKI